MKEYLDFDYVSIKSREEFYSWRIDPVTNTRLQWYYKKISFLRRNVAIKYGEFIKVFDDKS